MNRIEITHQIEFAFEVTPCVALLGPRQCGKTTEAREYAKCQRELAPQNYFDLENTRDVIRLQDPILALSALSGLIVIDEVQIHPHLFKTLRVLIDDKSLNQRYLILGSASRQLLKQSSESLAGRITYIEMGPFSYLETKQQQRIWIRGGFPLSFLAKNEEISFAWRKAYIKTYLEQDIPNLGIDISPENLRRFWMMLAQSQGNIFNASDIGRSIGLSHKTIQHYADILTGTFMVRQLKPWYENIAKRQVKSPKIYIRDTGIFHTLLDIKQHDELLVHPKLGASWESFVLEQLINLHAASPEECYFWASHQGAELDLLIIKNDKRLGFEIKFNSSPQMTKSMHIVMDNLKLDKLVVIYPGTVDYLLAENIAVIGFENYFFSNESQGARSE
ncbi:MAG: ATP-binding protein [Gammaproteobacteria bacterium]|nr:ATP-binding protein [Gammaproteobacteria bacterium]